MCDHRNALFSLVFSKIFHVQQPKSVFIFPIELSDSSDSQRSPDRRAGANLSDPKPKPFRDRGFK
jgi:hypothetical protein